MGRFASLLSLMLLLAGLAAAQAQNDDAALCRTTGDAAIAACTRLITAGKYKDHDLALLYNRRGAELEKKADLDRALADYNEALRIDPKYAVAYNNRAVAFNKKTEYDRAIGYEVEDRTIMSIRLAAQREP